MNVNVLTENKKICIYILIKSAVAKQQQQQQKGPAHFAELMNTINKKMY